MRLLQTRTNLFENLAKFAEQGRVVVQVTADANWKREGMVHIAGSDLGSGISNQAFQGLFKSFYRSDGSSTRKDGSTCFSGDIFKYLVERVGDPTGVMNESGKGVCVDSGPICSTSPV